MKHKYNYGEGTYTRTCPVCGYEYTSECGYDGKTIEGDEPFIEMEDALHSEDRGSYYSPIRSHTVYACPKCGVLQMKV